MKKEKKKSVRPVGKLDLKDNGELRFDRVGDRAASWQAQAQVFAEEAKVSVPRRLSNVWEDSTVLAAQIFQLHCDDFRLQPHGLDADGLVRVSRKDTDGWLRSATSAGWRVGSSAAHIFLLWGGWECRKYTRPLVNPPPPAFP